MKFEINHIAIKAELMQVPDLNFGQFQRWKEYQPITYKIELALSDFTNKIDAFFNEFRVSEKEDDDPMGHIELIAFKKANWPTFEELQNNDQNLLSDLLTYNAYEILQLLLKEKLPIDTKSFYSVNSIDRIDFTKSTVVVSGICFLVNRK